jgi:hypothetical protein
MGLCQAHFAAHDYAAALQTRDTYLAYAPRGNFALEASYNRALALARLGRIADALQALALFAAGAHGDYRRRDAQRLLRLRVAAPCSRSPTDCLLRDATRPKEAASQ